ncbi:MAG TPA: sigma-70 family RNA polymerase sigma factor [Puia sp.]|nr:sigma-70 family RNA polymerase sigma factor [Puia sp.]
MDSHFNQFKKGSEKAFRYYFDLYARPLCAFAFFYCKDHMEAQDIVQECFLHLFANREKINEEEHLKNFLFKVARNRTIDRRRTKEKRMLREQAWAGDQPGWDAQHDDVEQMKALVLSRIYELYRRMPARRKEIFWLYFYQRMDVRAIARIRGLKESTVHNHLQQAYSYLIKEMPDPALLIWMIILLSRRDR